MKDEIKALKKDVLKALAIHLTIAISTYVLSSKLAQNAEYPNVTQYITLSLHTSFIVTALIYITCGFCFFSKVKTSTYVAPFVISVFLIVTLLFSIANMEALELYYVCLNPVFIYYIPKLFNWKVNWFILLMMSALSPPVFLNIGLFIRSKRRK